jgi:hypothetical protein
VYASPSAEVEWLAADVHHLEGVDHPDSVGDLLGPGLISGA